MTAYGMVSLHRVEDRAAIARTPSPTPSEEDALATARGERRLGMVAWLKKYWTRLVALALTITIVVLFSHYSTPIVQALGPESRWLRQTRGGWLIPIGLLIVLSFPPLFGTDIILVLAAFTWGLGVGFGISAAGTLIGEVIIFYVFRHLCGARAQRRESSNLEYATLAHIVRAGGWRTVLLVRYSAIPTHLSTALFGVCGLGLWPFLFASVLSLPKLLSKLYIGYALAQAGTTDATASEAMKWSVLVFLALVTLFAMRQLRAAQAAVLPTVVRDRQKRRQMAAVDAEAIALAAPMPLRDSIANSVVDSRDIVPLSEEEK